MSFLRLELHVFLQAELHILTKNTETLTLKRKEQADNLSRCGLCTGFPKNPSTQQVKFNNGDVKSIKHLFTLESYREKNKVKLN